MYFPENWVVLPLPWLLPATYSTGMETGLKVQQPGGFTLLELLITMSIAAILLLIGIPGLQEFNMRQRMSSAINVLHTHLAFARNQAIRFNAHVIACPGDLSNGCTDDSDWSNGWIVFSDSNGDSKYQSPENIHRSEPGLALIMIHSSSGRPSLHFYPNGSAPGSNGSITFCDSRGPAKARKLVISNVGRIRRDEAPSLEPEHCPPLY